MDTEEFTVSSVIPESPNRIYSAWMDERHHSAFTGARATVDPWVGGRVIAHDGLIDATHVYLVTGSRIAMTWRTRDFPKGSNDSQVDITFEPIAGGTQIEVKHTKIPPGLGAACEKIWTKLYLGPMKDYFGKPGAMKAAYAAAKKAGHLPLSGIKASRPAPRRPFVPRRNCRPKTRPPKKRKSRRRPASASSPKRSTFGSWRVLRPLLARKRPARRLKPRRRPKPRVAPRRPLARRSRPRRRPSR